MFLTLSQQTFWSGWLVALLLAAQVALPYLLRKISPQKPSPITVPPGTHHPAQEAQHAALRGNSMRSHYFLGFVLPAGALAHAWIPMASGRMPRTSMTGLWLATYALGLLFVQLLLGVALRRIHDGGAGSSGWGLRRVHFTIMLAIAVLALAHMFLNRA